MKLKLIIAVLCFMPVFVLTSNAQAPTYNFAVITSSVTESDTTVVACYITTNIAPTIDDSIVIVHASGTPTPGRIDLVNQTVVHFAAGQSSAAFTITLHDDTFPENPEHIIFNLQTYGTFDTIGVNNYLDVTLLDNDLPATISFISDSAWVWEDRDTFINGVYDVDPSPFYLGIQVNNPNPFYVRYYADNLDVYRQGGQPNITAYAGGVDFYFNGELCYAPPGISTYYKFGSTIKQTYVHPDKYFYGILRNVDANIITDSLTFVTIKTDDFYDNPSVSFDNPGTSVSGDTTLRIALPITILNNNRNPLYFHVDTMNIHSTFPGPDFTIENQNFGYGHGTTYDTVWVDLINRHLINDTVTASFVIRGVIGNTSADTLFQLTIIDTGTLVVSFKGAGFAHLKDDSIGYVQVYTSSPVTYPVTADVTYLNGNAVMGVDFLWRDTSVTFPAYSYDTISLPVIMLKNHIHDGNKQVNLLLSNVSPPSVQYDIRQYTYTIIDNDSTASYPAGISNLDNSDQIKVYPNPFSNELNIHTSSDRYDASIINMIGEKIAGLQGQSGNSTMDLSGLSPGMYLLRISSNESNYVQLITKQ